MYGKYYGSNLDPSAPVIDMVVRASRESQPTQTIEGFIDTGADATIIPLTVLQNVRALRLRSGRMRGVTGKAVKISLFLVTLEISDITLTGIRAIGGDDLNECLIGRDVLNQLIVTLNGLGEETTIRDQ